MALFPNYLGIGVLLSGLGRKRDGFRFLVYLVVSSSTGAIYLP